MRADLGILPHPRRTSKNGGSITLTPGIPILAPEIFLATARWLADRLKQGSGWQWEYIPSASRLEYMAFPRLCARHRAVTESAS